MLKQTLPAFQIMGPAGWYDTTVFQFEIIPFQSIIGSSAPVQFTNLGHLGSLN